MRTESEQDRLVLRDWWLPPELDPETILEGPPLLRRLSQGWLQLEHRAPSPSGLQRLIGHLKRGRSQVLEHRSMDSILDSIDRVSALWLNPRLPERRVCIRGIAAVSGLSEPSVTHAIELEMRSSRRGDLLRALERELGSAHVLDDFTEQPLLGGRTFARGPGLIGAICSSNIPALPHLSAMRALLVKSAFLGRTSADEPIFLPLYLSSLARVDAELARCVASVHWSHDDRALETCFLEGLDHLIAYGSDQALEALASRAPRRLRCTWHGHRMGFSVVLRSALQHRSELSSLADALAYDFSVFEQHACLSPQVLLVEEGAALSPQTLATAVSESMETWCELFPPRRLSAAEQATRRSLLAALELRQAMGEEIHLVSPRERLQGVVVLEPAAPLQPCPEDRFVRVMPVQSVDQVLSLLEGRGSWLQNAAIAGEGPEAEGLRRGLARLGVSRICTPGRMGLPSRMWHHDGVPRLGELVRWCDEDRRLPGSGGPS